MKLTFNTNLNCMTVVCSLKRVMIDTSMKGFGSGKANTFLEITNINKINKYSLNDLDLRGENQ